jgi:hypothetical protein
MENKDYFKTQTHSLYDIKSTDFIETDNLIQLITDEKLKEKIKNKYSLDKNYTIEIGKIEFLYQQIYKYSKRFNLIRLEAKESDVTCQLKFDTKDQKPAFIFKIKNGNDNEVFYDLIEAESIYDSVALFYNSKSLSQYVKSMSKNHKKKELLSDLNDSWAKYYEKNQDSVKTRLFRILNHNDNYYLKSINSSAFKEYGIAESFVMTVLELNKFKSTNPSVEFFISSVSISESKLDLIISQKKSIPLVDVGFLRSSVSIRNEDQGNTSFGVYSTLEFFPNATEKNKIYLFPNRDENKIDNSIRSSHTASLENFLETFSNISELFNAGEKISEDFKFYNGSTSYDELRAKIEHKIRNANSPFKKVTKLVNLFSREHTGQINNLETLLKICAASNEIEMEYDLKFKLRYLISNVLLYNSNNY